jgi:hypothetical protein
MREIRTSGLMSGIWKRNSPLPRQISTLPKFLVAQHLQESGWTAAVLNVRPTLLVEGSEKEAVLSFDESDLFGSQLLVTNGPRFQAGIGGAAAPTFLQLFYRVGSSDFQVMIGHTD